MTDPSKMTRSQREHYHFLSEAIHAIETTLRGRIEESGLIPPEWHQIARTRGRMPKVRVNLWVEGDVVKFFKGMGSGYTTRMAEVLRAFSDARLAGVLSGPEGVAYYPVGSAETTERLQSIDKILAAAEEIFEGALKELDGGTGGPGTGAGG